MRGTSPSLVGSRFGRLLVVSRAASTESGRARWRVRCDCGAEKLLTTSLLTRTVQPVRSCGCLARDITAARSIRHGHRVNTFPAAASETYNSWSAMKARCSNPNVKGYEYWGGLGVTVCDRWLGSFEAFLADMGERPAGTSLDRIDPFGNYEPANCRWATPTEQARNRRGKAAA